MIGGLVRPEDMPKPADAGHRGGGDTGEGDGADATGSDRLRGHSISAPMASAPDPEAEARKEAGVGIGLSDDLRSIRTALVKAHLDKDFEAAFDLMLFQLGRGVFTHGYKTHALDIAIRETADRPTTRVNDQDFGPWSPGEAMLADRSGLPLDWLAIEDDGESFAALRALPQARPELEATVARLGIDFAGLVRPTADMLWSRINKGRILDIARETLGGAWAAARAKSKKPDLARAMEEAFAAGSPPLGITADSHAAALAWTPPGFAAFDAGCAGVEDAGAVTAVSAEDSEPAADPEALSEPEDAGTPERVVESSEAPEAAEPGPAAIAANGNGNGAAASTGDGLHPVDGHGSGEPDGPDAEAPVRANGHDNGGGLDIPEFLRRV